MTAARRRWLAAYITLAIVGGLALMSGAFGRWVILPGIAALASGVAALVVAAIDDSQT